MECNLCKMKEDWFMWRILREKAREWENEASAYIEASQNNRQRERCWKWFYWEESWVIQFERTAIFIGQAKSMMTTIRGLFPLRVRTNTSIGSMLVNFKEKYCNAFLKKWVFIWARLYLVFVYYFRRNIVCFQGDINLKADTLL